MKKINLFMNILFSIAILSCTDVGFKDAKIFYENNNEMLIGIVQKMLYDKDYTFINIEKISGEEYNINIEKIDSNYNQIYLNDKIKINELESFSKKYYAKLSKSNDTNLDVLKSILLWMINNDINIIRVKTPEYNYLTVKLSQNTGIRFETSQYKSPDIITLDPIGNNWYFVIYK